MTVRKLSLGSSGRLTLPADVMRVLGLPRGGELLLVQEGKRVALVAAGTVGSRLVDDMGGWESLAAPAFDEMWASEAENGWDRAARRPPAA